MVAAAPATRAARRATCSARGTSRRQLFSSTMISGPPPPEGPRLLSGSILGCGHVLTRLGALIIGVHYGVHQRMPHDVPGAEPVHADARQSRERVQRVPQPAPLTRR